MLEKIISYIPSILGLLVICFFVYKSNRNSKTNRYFIFLNLNVALWLLLLLVADLTDKVSIALIAVRLAIVASTMVGLLFVVFCVNFPSPNKTTKSKLFLLTIPAIVLSFLALTPSMVSGVTIEAAGARLSSVSSLYTVDTLVTVAYFLLGAYFLLRNRRKSSLKQKKQVDIFFMGIGIALGMNILTGYVFALFNIGGNSVLLGNLSIFVFVGATAYAIVKHGLFDIRLAAVRSVAYLGSLLTLSGIYYLFAYVVSVTLFQGELSSTVSISPINIGLALVLAFIFQPIKSFFDKTTDTIFYRDRYHADEFYARLSEVLTTTTDLRNLLERASAEIGTTLKAEQVFFFVQYNHVHHVSSGTLHHSVLPLKDAHRLNEFVKKEGQDMIVAQLLPEEHAIHRMLISHRVAIMMPLMRGGTILGYLALGEQRSSGYSNHDIKVLKTISDELVIAIQNALSIQEVKDINIHLQQRIDTATAELRSSNTQLRHLDKTKDEFLSMASHQLRTPLTSVKGYLSMVLEGDAGKVTDAQKRLLGEAFTSSERMVHLIHDFLNVSRLQTGKFMLELHPYDIVKLVDEEVRSLQRAAETRSMKLEFINSIDTLTLNIDENKIRQVVMNYIDNALFYSHDESTIRVELTMADDQVELRVKDTGIGVPRSEQAHLFSKFYRATNARKQRPDGTGVGIFLAKKVIVEHGGDVLFESVEDKGSTFGFMLPIKRLAVSSDEKADQPDQ